VTGAALAPSLPAAPALRLPGAFVRYAAAVGVAAALTFAVAAVLGAGRAPFGDAAFWLLAGLCLAGELLPIRLPRRAAVDEVTVSTAFAFAILLLYGPLPALAVYAVTSIAADLVDRSPLVKAGFNAAQYAVATGAAALLLALTGPGTTPIGVAGLAAVLAAAVVFFVANHVLAGTAAALLSGEAVVPYLLRDLPFQVWTAGFQLTLAPVVAHLAQLDLLLVPLLFFPVLAIYLGGREAVVNEHRAVHDALTDLPNRHLLAQRLGDALAAARATDSELVVMLADLDDFKAVNDALGHQIGDRLLQGVAERLVATAPAGATVARLGGDEFALLVPRSSLPLGMALGRELLDGLEEPFEIDSFSLDVRASIGLAAFPAQGLTPEVLMKHADLALYRAKEQRTGCEAYVEEHDDTGFDRLALADQLRRGIERGELELHYQPKLALRPGRLHGVEALVRWRHPLLGLIGAEGFIPLAEQTNLIKPLTTWVLDAALGQCRAWRDDGLELRVAVNVSTRSLLDRQLPGQVEAMLERWGLPAAALQLEITESRIVADFGRARDVLHQLRDRGVGVAIDDFGTGYSSLAQLQQLPADEIKIDKSFVLNMETNANDAAIVRSTVGLGRNLDLDITAEGVETPETCDRLMELGCDYAQGYFFGRPVPAEVCEREMRRFVRRETVSTSHGR